MRFTLSSLTALAMLAASSTTVVSAAAAAADPSAAFLVDGKKLPGISSVIGDVGTSYAGRLPITSKANESDKLFFWLWPPAKGAPDKDLTIWFGGGPGCSGLGEALQGIGPFSLPDNNQGKTIVQRNANAWNQNGWTLFLDQPGYTGFSQVAPRDFDEKIIAQHFRGFLANLYKTFPNIAQKNLYLAGESYAGQYIPHIADYLYNQTGADRVPLKGVGIISGRYAPDPIQIELPYYEYVLKRQQDLQLNSTEMAAITKRANELGLVGYVDKALQYPPKGPVVPPAKFLANKGDSLSYEVNPRILEANDCFDYYNVRTRCPAPYNPLSLQNNFIENTKGFRKAIHVGEEDSWKSCIKPSYIFPHGDPTPFAMQDGSLSRTVDKSDRAVLFGGADDFKLLSLGTQLGLQNITWGGKQGFQARPNKSLVAGGKKTGVYGSERKLTWAQVDNAGHFVPMQQPETALKLHKFLLGQIDESALAK